MTYREPPPGWYTFGTHARVQVPLEFSEELDDDGMPFWERPVLHDTLLHIEAGGFGVPAPGCPACRRNGR